jgi:hypothetical protein
MRDEILKHLYDVKNAALSITAILIMKYSTIYQIVVSFCLLLTTLFFVEFRRNSHFSERA